MRVLKDGEVDRTVRLIKEDDSIQSLCYWIDGEICGDCDDCIILEYIEESKKRFPDGMTYDEAFEFLESK